MKNYLLTIVISLFASNLIAQDLTGTQAQQRITGAERVIMQPETSIPQFIKFQQGNEMDFRSFENFLNKNYKSPTHLGIKLLTTETDKLGFTHYRYQQTYDGIPIAGTMYLVHVRNGKIETMNGLFFDHVSSSKATLTESAALNYALAAVPAKTYRWQVPAEERMLQQEKNNSGATWFPKGELMYASPDGKMDAENLRLCYRFDIFSTEPLERKYVYVDASSGEIIQTEDRIKTVDAVGTAVTAYSGTRTMTADSYSGSYRLRETGRGNGIETYNLNHSTSNYSGAADFTDADNYWNNVNANQDQYATDAHWGAEVVYDFYQTFFNRNSIDGNGFKLKSYVHYSTGYLNAFWDGTEMTYGDGSSGYTPLTTMDICGHEISHGLTEFTSNLTYSYESGALNESFSDCMGEAMEFWVKPSTADWLIGSEIGAAFRSMSDPHSYGDPDTYQGLYWYTGGSDNGGVHTNSSVMNHWFYILSVGETGTNDNGASYSINGITLTEAQAILFRANTVYFTSSTNYSQARQYTIQAATDLYGGCSTEAQAVTNAWYAVGVGSAFSATVTAGFSVTPTMYCSAPASVTFNNTSTNAATYSWNFGDGGTSTSASPTHTYQNEGVYTVKLVANGGTCGSDSITQSNYINISSSNACSANMPQNGVGATQTACAGTLYDSGGPNGNYQDNTASTITISPPGASTIQLSFVSFNMESGYDFLYVFDGPSEASPLIATLSGNYLPSLITSSGSSITIGQYSDGGLTFSGYEIHWQCSNASIAPVAAFTADVTSTCSGVINFTDQSLNVPTSWSWDFGDGFTSSSQNPSHTYATSGVYSVALTATNANGNNSLTKTNYIGVSKSGGPSTTGASVCNSGSVVLQASGSGTLNWYDAAAGGNLVNTGTSYTTPTLNNTTNYYVEAVTSYSQQGDGPASNNIGSSSIYSNSTDRYLIFDCYAPVKLVSVKVYASGQAQRTIELRNSANTILLSKVVNMPDGEQVITLNWDIPVATNLHLAIGGPANLQRNTSGAVYPYTLNGVISITANSAAAAGYYYYFYDWKLQQPTCISQRSVTTATVIQVPAAITPAGSTSLCPGNSVVLNANTGAGLSYQWKLNGSDISGATTSSYTTFQGGDFTVLVTQNGCSNTSSPVTVSIIHVSANVTPTGTVSICQGGSVVLNANTGAGLSYQWKLNGSDINGATASSYNATSAGNYSVVISESGCSSNSNTVTINVTQVSASVTPESSTSICAGSSVILDANTGAGLSYQWKLNGSSINGATASTFTASNAGNYAVDVTLSSCTATSTPVTVSIISNPVVSISASGSTSFCKGASVTLTASPSGLVYQWTKNGNNIGGATAQSYLGNKTGNYACKVTHQCGQITSNTIAATQLATPIATITPPGSVTICSGSNTTLQANSGVNLGYQWKKGASNISGATNISLSVSAKGTYKVVVTNTSTGCSKTSAGTKVTVQTCKANDVVSEAISLLTIYPNPSSGEVMMSFNNASINEKGIVRVKNLVGQTVETSIEELHSGNNEFPLHLSMLAAGIYLVELTSGEKTFVAKLIIEK